MTTHFILTTGFGIYDACDMEGKARNLSQFFSNTIHFSFDAENGAEPEIPADGACATSMGAIGIQEELYGEYRELKPEDCLVLEPGPQVKDECLKVDDDMAEYAAV